MNKKGFTLVEVLLVIVLIAMVTAIVLPNITDSIETSKEKKFESYASLVKDNLEMYVMDNKEDLWAEGANGTISIVESDLRARTKEMDIGDCTIKSLSASRTANNYTYSVTITCNNKDYTK